MKTRTLNSAITLLAVALATFASSAGTLLAQDSLRIIELSAPGQSAPVSIPAGHVFTFSLFQANSGSTDYAGPVGIVTYTAPISYVYQHNGFAKLWFVGPAKVALKSSGSGARMQLYTLKLPPGVTAGVLHANSQTHSVSIPKDSLFTSLFGFQNQVLGGVIALPPLTGSQLAIRTPSGLTYADSPYGGAVLNPLAALSPNIFSPNNFGRGGAASLHNPNAPASSVVNGFYHDDLDSVSPTDDFVGPGTATFSLPSYLAPLTPTSPPIAFYCYRITPANVIVADTSPPSLKVTAPVNAKGSTTSASFLVKGSVTGNIHPITIRFRVKAPNSSYGSWTSIALGGDQKTKSWERSVGLSSNGVWYVQIQAFDGQNNASTVQTVTLTSRR